MLTISEMDQTGPIVGLGIEIYSAGMAAAMS